MLYELTGAQIKQLVQGRDAKDIITGLDLENMLVGGRPIVDSEKYRVILDSAMAHDQVPLKVLQGVEPQTRFRLDHDLLRPSRGGKIFRVRDIALTTLDPQTQETIQRGTSASLILTAGITVDYCWKH